MGRPPAGRHSAPPPPPAGRSARFRWLVALGLACALLAAAVALDLARQPSGSDAATTSLGGPSVQSRIGQALPSQYDRARATPGGVSRSSLAPATSLTAPASPTAAASAPPAAPTATAPAAPPAAPTPSQTVPAGNLTPSPTAQNQTPTGTNQLAWTEAILKALGDPLTDANIKSVGYWMQNEAGSPPSGIVGANNPINVSEPGYGGWPIKDEGNGYSLYSYPTPQDGIQALVAYINPYGYPDILNALKAGVGLSSPSLSTEFGIYSGHGYTAVPDAWGLSQGVPLT
jgi:hypothetical protein